MKTKKIRIAETFDSFVEKRKCDHSISTHYILENKKRIDFCIASNELERFYNLFNKKKEKPFLVEHLKNHKYFYFMTDVDFKNILLTSDEKNECINCIVVNLKKLCANIFNIDADTIIKQNISSSDNQGNHIYTNLYIKKEDANKLIVLLRKECKLEKPSYQWNKILDKGIYNTGIRVCNSLKNNNSNVYVGNPFEYSVIKMGELTKMKNCFPVEEEVKSIEKKLKTYESISIKKEQLSNNQLFSN